jgi:hypothetical protein
LPFNSFISPQLSLFNERNTRSPKNLRWVFSRTRRHQLRNDKVAEGEGKRNPPGHLKQHMAARFLPRGIETALTIHISKDPENPGSYRPISLTSCLGKVMEKMVNRRLVLQTTDVLNILQSSISQRLLVGKHLALI